MTRSTTFNTASNNVQRGCAMSYRVGMYELGIIAAYLIVSFPWQEDDRGNWLSLS